MKQKNYKALYPSSSLTQKYISESIKFKNHTEERLKALERSLILNKKSETIPILFYIK